MIGPTNECSTATTATGDATTAFPLTEPDLENHYTIDNLVDDLEDVVKDCFTSLHVAKRLAEAQRDVVAIRFPNDNFDDYESFTHGDVWDLIDKLAGWIRRTPLGTLAPRAVVGLMDNLNHRSYLAMLGLLGAGLIPLLINTKLANDSIAGLMGDVDGRAIITSPELYKKAQGCTKHMVVETIMLPFSQVVKLPRNNVILPPCSRGDLDKTFIMYHSSGSTARPKVISIPNSYGLTWRRARQTEGPRKAVMAVAPVFHVMGGATLIMGSLSPGNSVPTFPLTKIFPPRPSEVLRSLRVGQVKWLITVPAYYEALVAHMDLHPEEWEDFETMDDLSFGGAPMNESIRRRLRAHGLSPVSWYGATEFGLAMVGTDDHGLDPSIWMKPVSGISYRFVPTEMKGVYELIILDDCCVFFESLRNHPDGYASSDYFLRHPEYPECWSYFSRSDDLLVHTNGEKTRALAMELKLKELRCDEIATCAVVGHQRPRTAALVELQYNNIDSPIEEAKAKTRVLEAIKEVNAQQPTFSWLSEDMVYFLPRAHQLPTTPKGNVERHKVTAAFGSEIDRLYASKLRPVDRSRQLVLPFSRASNGQDTESTSIPSIAEEEESIVEKIASLIGMNVTELLKNHDKPLFDLGLTSQMAIELQDVLSVALGKSVDVNFVFEHPTTEEILREINSKSLKPAALSSSMEIPLYTQDISYADDAKAIWKARRAEIDCLSTVANVGCSVYPNLGAGGPSENKKGITVLLTGATGSLGCQLVAALLRSPDVIKIYALMRGPNPRERLMENLQRKTAGVIEQLETWPQKLEALSYDMKDAKFGVGYKKYVQLILEVGFVIHNAWKMNFNQKVRQFDSDCLSSLMHIIKFCVTPGCSKKQLAFISSVSAVAGAGIYPIPNEIFGTKQLEFAVPMGYGQSKSVAELMINHATSRLNFAAKIFRCGQLGGDTVTGAWNKTDLMAILTCNAGSPMKMIPRMGGDGSVVPMDVAANAITEIMFSMPTGGCSVFNVQNPSAESWDHWIDCLRKAGLDFEVVDLSEYIAEVKKDKSNMATLLLPFLERQAKSPASNIVPEHIMDVEETIAHSFALRHCPKVTPDMAGLYLRAWGIFTNP